MLSKRVAFTKSLPGRQAGAAYFGGSSRKGRVFVLSASSGTGKTTLAHELLRKDKNIVQSVSCTTRAPRGNEHHGRDYYFVSKKEFIKLKKKNGFLEWANVFGRFYGTPKAEVEKNLKKGKDVLLLIDVQGARQVKKTKPDAVFIFLSPPSKEELRRRLEKRGTDSKKEIEKRLRIATQELEQLNDLGLCDYRIMNRDIEKAREILEAIIKAERK